MRFAILLCAIVSVSAFAQEPDTTDWHRYIPLELGNEWHYRWTYITGSNPPQAEIYDYLYEVVGDSLVDGTVYKKVVHCVQGENGPPPYCDFDFVLVRIDEELATVLRLWDNGEDLWLHYPCELDAPFSDTPRDLTCPWTGVTLAVVSGEAVDEHPVGGGVMTGSLTLKTYEIGDCGLYLLLSDAGLLYWKCLGDPSDYTLEYAKLDGVEYGEPVVVVVASEGDQSLPERDERLSIYPNPVRAQATLAYVLDDSGNLNLDVFDLQGRLVDSVVLGEQASGEHILKLDTSNWATGLYRVRVTTDRGFSATKGIIVIH